MYKGMNLPNSTAMNRVEHKVNFLEEQIWFEYRVLFLLL